MLEKDINEKAGFSIKELTKEIDPVYLEVHGKHEDKNKGDDDGEMALVTGFGQFKG